MIIAKRHFKLKDKIKFLTIEDYIQNSPYAATLDIIILLYVNLCIWEYASPPYIEMTHFFLNGRRQTTPPPPPPQKKGGGGGGKEKKEVYISAKIYIGGSFLAA